MCFTDRAAWWRGGADRGDFHEGLDICCYRTGDGRRLSLDAGARIPVTYAGEVVSIVDDFLGRSVFVAHDATDGRGRRLHSVFGHVVPTRGLMVGVSLGDGEEVGTIAGPPVGKSAVPPHLHLTLAWVARGGGGTRLDWGVLRDRDRVLLLDPLPLLHGSCNSSRDSSSVLALGEGTVGR